MDNASYSPSLTSNELGARISALGVKKANTQPWQLLFLGILAGLYIALGAQVFLVALDSGFGKIGASAVFAVGLVFVVIAGAELFTGDIIMAVGAITRHFPFRRMMRSWGVVYLGNLIGSIATAYLIYWSGLLGSPESPNSLSQLATSVADAKLAIPFGQAVIRAFFCNILVILAILMAVISKDTISKIACCILPIMAFVACGYEHCVANMYLIPLGRFATGDPGMILITMWVNIIPVTIGNILGGLFILLIHPNRIRQLRMLWKKRHEK